MLKLFWYFNYVYTIDWGGPIWGGLEKDERGRGGFEKETGRTGTIINSNFKNNHKY